MELTPYHIVCPPNFFMLLKKGVFVSNTDKNSPVTAILTMNFQNTVYSIERVYHGCILTYQVCHRHYPGPEHRQAAAGDSEADPASGTDQTVLGPPGLGAVYFSPADPFLVVGIPAERSFGLDLP